MVMMGHKHLHELLSEDQEPFHLKNYIADRRCKLKSTRTAAGAGKPHLQLTRRKPSTVSTSSTTNRNFCINHVCLFAFQDSPDVRKSPFVDFPSPATKSPCNNHNATAFLHVPARTAAMLLDAAMRVQKQSPSKNVGFGLFGSLLKRLKERSTRTRRRDISSVNITTSRKIRDKKAGNDVVAGFSVTGSAHERRFPRSGNNSRLSSKNWSEKSSEMETSCSSISVHDTFEIESVGVECEKCFCSSPSSPFRFSLHKSPSPGRRSLDFISPATSPSRRFQQEKENYEAKKSQETHVEEEEQFSPVSVLDPPFEDDEDEEHDEQDGYDLKCSYARVERTKHQLLQKLRRFERLAELDPIALEKHMLEEHDKDDDGYEDLVSDEEKEVKPVQQQSLRVILDHLGVQKIPLHMKRLISDIVAEEGKIEEHGECEVMVKRVRKRLDSWEMVKFNTIDMMVGFELKKEKSEGWKRHDEEKVREVGMNMEVAIFGMLVEELAQELVTTFGHF